MALLAGGLSFGQGLLGGRSEKKQRRRYGRRLNRALGATEALQGAALGQQEALTRQATQQRLGGFDVAKREASRLGRGAKQSALDRESQMLGRASQGLASRGLGSTTLGANLQRGIASDTNRELSSIDEGLAGLFGNLALGRGEAEAGGSEALSALAGRRGDLFSQLAQMRSLRDLYGSSPWGGGAPLPGREAGLGQNLLSGLQTGLGFYSGAGGGFGGGGDPYAEAYGRAGGGRVSPLMNSQIPPQYLQMLYGGV